MCLKIYFLFRTNYFKQFIDVGMVKKIYFYFKYLSINVAIEISSITLSCDRNRFIEGNYSIIFSNNKILIHRHTHPSDSHRLRPTFFFCWPRENIFCSKLYVIVVSSYERKLQYLTFVVMRRAIES